MPEYRAGPRKRPPTHPGQVIASQLEELSLTAYAAAPLLGVTRAALGNVIKGTSAVSPDMALRLGKFFGNGPDLWMKMQADVDLWNAREKIAPAIAAIKPVKRP
jgi:addiction module HigA family antidote